MDAFSKIRKSAGREEQKRQMINKAIDLLHKLANKRLGYEEAKAEISRVVSEYYVLDDFEGVGGDQKINLELMINNAFDVVNGVNEERLNLYQAIMLMNKVMAHQERINTTPLTVVKEGEMEKKVEQKIKIEEVKEKEENIFASCMNKVVENKRKLEESIEDLNDILKNYGFTLSALEPK
jgi:hypothetical protein